MDTKQKVIRIAWTIFCVALLIAATLLLKDAAAQPASKVNETSSQKNNLSMMNISREVEIREMFRENMSWATGQSMGTKWYKWPNSRGVKKVFDQLTEADIPVLIEIIRSYNDSTSPPTLREAEYISATWVLSLFKDKAEPYAQHLYETAATDTEKEKWADVLRSIEVRKIEERELEKPSK